MVPLFALSTARVRAGAEPSHRADYMLYKMYQQGRVELDLYYTSKTFRVKYLEQVKQEQAEDPVRIYSLSELEFLIGRYPRNLNNVLELYVRFGILKAEGDPRKGSRKLAYNFKSPPLPEEAIITFELIQVLNKAKTFLYSRELIKRSRVLNGAPGITTTKVGRIATVMVEAGLIDMEPSPRSNRRYRKNPEKKNEIRRHLESLLLF